MSDYLIQRRFSRWRMLGFLLMFIGLWALAVAYFKKQPTTNEADAIITQTEIDADLGELKTYQIAEPEKGILFLFADAGGLTPQLDQQARNWAQKSYLVVVINWPDLVKHNTKDCLDIASPVLARAKNYQQRYDFDADMAPMVMGEGEGAAAVYMALAQAAEGAFHAGISVNFCPSLGAEPKLCAGRTLHSISDSQGISLNAEPLLGANWYLFQAQGTCSDAAKVFADQISSAKFNSLQRHDQQLDFTEIDALLNWLDPRLTEQAKSSSAHGDLPLVEVTAAEVNTKDYMVIFLTGDGGWAELDKTLAGEFSQQGVATLALDSLSYFWKKRTPEETSLALSQVMRNYRASWHKSKIIFVGYSFGADVLPFILNRLPADDQQSVAGVVYLGLSDQANFEFHLTNWLDTEQPASDYKTLPEIEKLSWLKSLCIKGAEDDTTGCEQAAKKGVELQIMPGDHHYDENYTVLAQHILEFAARQTQGEAPKAKLP